MHLAVLLNLKLQILSLFDSNDLGVIKNYMGIKINYDQEAQLLTMLMATYCLDIAAESHLASACPQCQPMSPTHGLKWSPHVVDQAAIATHMMSISALL